MELALVISIATLLVLACWQTHRRFSRTAFWWVFGSVIAINTILYATGCSLELVDLPALMFVGPLLPFESTPPIVDFAIVVGIAMTSALIWGYITGRVVGAVSGRRTRLRRARELCPTCGYDLTGNVSGVCPECGGQIQKRITS